METTNRKSRVFPITTFIHDLPASLVPQPSLQPWSNGSRSAAKRLIFVGDVHGMREPLVRLLDSIKFDRAMGDHLVFVGDMVNKGNDSPGVIDLAMELGASAVRGNHDNAVLDAAGARRYRSGEWLPEAATRADDPVEASPRTSSSVACEQVPGNAAESAPHSDTTIKTAAALSARQLKWLSSLPLILRIDLRAERNSSLAKIVVVHAGLVPGVPLDQQDPHAVMHMRSLVVANGVLAAAEGEGEEGWAAVWERAQEDLQQQQRTLVVFGHDARRGLQARKYSVGLDSGSVYGNQLSALIWSCTENGFVQNVAQVETVQSVSTTSHDTSKSLSSI
ncbi:phosphatase family [Cordyceps militaris]|uniref:Phosphatase family n=1 Tax=Cordyceps militaris TaxID=73501 RepID=A0A2H4SPB7_CORMI|nr:phosphatase family [Cordyceps militaris]